MSDPRATLRVMDTPHRRIVESWLWMVFNPQIEHCEAELGVADFSLTFHARTKKFDRLKPLAEALFPDGRLVFDDLTGDLPDYDALVTLHDGALASLLGAARTLFAVLNREPAFRELVEATRSAVLNRPADPSAELIPDFGLKESLRAALLAEVVAWQIENVVNGIGDALPPQPLNGALWSAAHRQLEQAAATIHPAETAGLQSARADFACAVTASRDGLKKLRKQLSRQYGVPVAPTIGAYVEEASK